MKHPPSNPFMTFLCSAFFSAMIGLLGHGDEPENAELKREIIETYCRVLSAAYTDSVEGAEKLQQTISEFLRSPSQSGIEQAKAAWIAARGPYMETEAARFYDGPIEAVEHLINAWPIDEAYVDSVQGFEAAGIINSSDQFPTLTKAIIQELNEKEGEKNISLGYHVIEFLLWGQDTDPMGPGRRSYTDYVVSDSNPAPARRGTYLKIVTELLLEALQQVAGEWADTGDNYRKKLLSMPSDPALSRILIGIGILSGPELSGERLTVAYVTKEQEEEHSCFSDTTHLDMINNARGIRNIYLGNYRRINGEEVSGKGIHHLLMEMDSEFAGEMKRWIQASLDLARKIPPPFDQAILGKRTAPGRMAIKALINSLMKQSNGTARAAKILNLPIHEQQFDSPI